MCLTHASRAARKGSGRRLSNTSVTYPKAEDSSSKDGVILHVVSPCFGAIKDLSLSEGRAAYQFVGGVTAHQDYDG